MHRQITVLSLVVGILAFSSAGFAAPPVLEVSPTSLEFSAYDGGANPANQILSIWRGGGNGLLNWEVIEDCNWLAVNPTSGQSTGEVDDVNVIVDISGLTGGTYNCQLTVDAGGAVNSPQVVDVNLYLVEVVYVPSEFPTIQDAIDYVVMDGSIVIVEPGIYTGAGNRDIDLSGKSITVRSTDPNDPNIVAATIIDCNGTVAEPHRGFYYYSLSDETTNLVIAGFTIINGYHNDGGGMYLSSGYSTMSNWTVRNCIISGNTADWQGGGIFIGSASANCKIDGCKFSNNTAGLGGGVCCRLNLTISNCTFSGNTSIGGDPLRGGGGIACYTCDSIITNCTITGNTASNGGGIYSVKHLSPIEIDNCILWDNEAPVGPEIYLSSFLFPVGPVTVSYSDVEGGYAAVHNGGDPPWFLPAGLVWGDGNIDEDPNFVNPDPNEPDYHLLPISPCINAGDPAVVFDPNEKDIDGQPRVLYGRVDIGVDEVYPIAGDFEPDEDVDMVDFVFFATYWLETGCGMCGGADLTGDGNVNFYDLKEFTDKWLAGL